MIPYVYDQQQVSKSNRFRLSVLLTLNTSQMRLIQKVCQRVLYCHVFQ